ncbi:MAG: hypothetical protein OXU44_01420 [Gammaproteobacteria bacterium]|nr:hypothetical protein [Gammaproteobacteria bacterium]MDD9807510.1 hypothetical protein [Gammaproteobacteria bacterium]
MAAPLFHFDPQTADPANRAGGAVLRVRDGAGHIDIRPNPARSADGVR